MSDIPKLTPIKTRPTKLDPAVWGEGIRDDDGEADVFEQAWFTLVQINTLLNLNRPIGSLNDAQEYALYHARAALERLFPREDEDDDIPF
jgi:hypothetical protein